MIRFFTAILIALIVLPSALADVSPEATQKLMDTVTPSLVAVQITWEFEYGKFDFVGPGIVVSDDGLVMLTEAVIAPTIPDAQLKDFKIIIPRGDKDDEEIDAVFYGRDERANVAYVKAKDPRKWKPVKFEDAPIKTGQTVLSVGLLPKDAGYKSYFQTGMVSTKLRGEIPMWLVTGGALAAVGSPVFDLDGKAIGFVEGQPGKQYLLHTSGGRRGGGRRGGGGGDEDVDPLGSISDPPNVFVPSSDFLFSLNDPPTPDKPIKLAWMGLPELTGLSKDVAEAFDLVDQPAVEVGDVVPETPAAKAGLKRGMKIVKINGQPIDRGDEPEELPGIMARKIMRMKPGTEVTLSVVTEPGKPQQDIHVTLGDRPERANLAERTWFDDLGFGARKMVFDDTYVRKLPPDYKGLVVSMIKAQSPAATAKLDMSDVITQFNNQPVTDLASFEKEVKAFREEKPKEALVIVVLRADQSTQTIRIEPPQQ